MTFKWYLLISKGLDLLFALRLNVPFHNGSEWVKLFMYVYANGKKSLNSSTPKFSP